MDVASQQVRVFFEDARVHFRDTFQRALAETRRLGELVHPPHDELHRAEREGRGVLLDDLAHHVRHERPGQRQLGLLAS